MIKDDLILFDYMERLNGFMSLQCMPVFRILEASVFDSRAVADIGNYSWLYL